MSNIDLTKLGTCAIISTDSLSDEEKRELEEMGYDIIEDQEDVWVYENDLNELSFYPDIITYDFDEPMLNEELRYYLPKTECWLVVANGCRWNGDDGYLITSNPLDTVLRDYDSCAYYVDGLGTNCLTVRECSHDVPNSST